MTTLPPPRPPVKPEPAPFRPLAAPPTASYWRDECQALHVLLSGRRQSDSYEVIPLSTDLGGCAFRWHKRGGESYDVLVNGTHSSCTCAGFSYAKDGGQCKHLWITNELLRLGVLTVAPDSAAADGDDDCPF